ncbi:hypothetical protein HJFPF1_04504 [Paramyrothecium foliicola]|nr:hypothetical protein HJFPF1_04504 [Paramyrothecium foliicola]
MDCWRNGSRKDEHLIDSLPVVIRDHCLTNIVNFPFLLVPDILITGSLRQHGRPLKKMGLSSAALCGPRCYKTTAAAADTVTNLDGVRVCAPAETEQICVAPQHRESRPTAGISSFAVEQRRPRCFCIEAIN